MSECGRELNGKGPAACPECPTDPARFLFVSTLDSRVVKAGSKWFDRSRVETVTVKTAGDFVPARPVGIGAPATVMSLTDSPGPYP